MNAQSHRLVFNPSRGCLMAVAETSRSSGKSSTSGGTRSTRTKRTRFPHSAEVQASNQPLAPVSIARAATNSIALSAPLSIGISNEDKTVSDSSLQGSGRDMFISAMQRLSNEGIQVNQIRGNWLNGGDSVNTAQYQANIATGMSPEQAAKNTWTGKVAADFGFTKVQSVTNSPIGVVVIFGK